MLLSGEMRHRQFLWTRRALDALASGGGPVTSGESADVRQANGLCTERKEVITLKLAVKSLCVEPLPGHRWKANLARLRSTAESPPYCKRPQPCSRAAVRPDVPLC